VRIGVVALAALVGACRGTTSSAYRTGTGEAAPFTGNVRIVVTTVPSGAQQVGIVEVDSTEELANAVEQFQARVAEMGGDTGVIDRYSTSFEIERQTRTEQYKCGTQTCTRTVSQDHEVATLHLSGRALLTRGTP
jgi:hypothetical protein